jgi:hypothetical protein
VIGPGEQHRQISFIHIGILDNARARRSHPFGS